MQIGDIAFFGGGVDDKLQPATDANRHQVVDNAALVVEQQRVAHPAFGKFGDVARHHCLEHRRRYAMQRHLPHVRHIEQPGPGSGVKMLGDNAGGILYRHLVAGERHHLGPARQMQRV